jgi:hypothetical protein
MSYAEAVCRAVGVSAANIVRAGHASVITDCNQTRRKHEFPCAYAGPTQSAELHYVLKTKYRPPDTANAAITDVYAVRVRESFKGEILRLQAELQLERQNSNGKARKVTEGEIVELMLEAYKAARRNGESSGNAVPLTKDVWDGVHEIARRLQSSPAEIVEQLVVDKIAELGLLPRKHA